MWCAVNQFGLFDPHHVGEYSLRRDCEITEFAVRWKLISIVGHAFVKQVLITKLRSANTVETRQYHKAAKALLVLIPLLGITYLVFLYAPSEGFLRHLFAYCRATLISTQVHHTSCN